MGKGEGSSSTDSESGFVPGPLAAAPFALPSCPFGTGVGGGELPNLLRSFRVM
jgi:hypothetical protein